MMSILFLLLFQQPAKTLSDRPRLIHFLSVPINIPEVLERLCYRYPSPLVDAVLEHEPGRRVVAVKNVTVNEEFFQGHFPGAPLMPGVLMIETLAQVATILLTHPVSGASAPGHAYLRGVDNAKFRLPVVPGDRLRLEVTMGPRRARLARAHARAYIGENIAAEAVLLMGLGPAEIGEGRPGVTVDASAVVHPSAIIGAGTVVGPHAVVGEHVTIGRDCRIGASSVVEGPTVI